MADAYRKASEGHYSPEYEKLMQIDRFGIEAVTGRKQLYFREYLEMTATENIIHAYQSRKSSKDWVEWARENPSAARILSEVECRL
jgi:hypothetical protein